MYIKIQKLNIHYKCLGDFPGRDVVVLLHGWGSNIANNAKMQAHLAEKFKVFALDLPGFGLSSLPLDIWGTEQYSAVISEFIALLGIENPILVGHSFGGKIALYLVANKMVCAKKLVLIASAGIKLPKNFAKKAKIISFKILKKMASLPFLKMIFQPRLDAYRKKFGSRDYRNASGIMRKILVKVVNEDFRNLLSFIDVPTLLIWGDQDDDTPLACGIMMEKIIPRAKLKILQNCGHHIFLDDWSQFTNVLNDFLF